jgi:hypothetical protein
MSPDHPGSVSRQTAMPQSRVVIYQNYYDPGQRGQLACAFTPHDWTTNPSPELREIAPMLHLYDAGLHAQGDVVGLVSWKFEQKAKISAQAFIDFVHEHPGYDAYFVNPFPQIAYHSFNIWAHAEVWHPGITALTQRLLDFCGMPVRLDALGRSDRSTLLYANYWAGTPAFWARYVAFVRPLVTAMTSTLPEHERVQYWSPSTYHVAAPQAPFIFERLFTTLLLASPDVRALAYPHTAEQVKAACWNEVERDVVECFGPLVDRWDSAQQHGADERRIFDGLLRVCCAYTRHQIEAHGHP